MKICRLIDCMKQTTQTSSLCGMHRARFTKYKSFDLPPKKAKKVYINCIAEGCNKLARSNYCSMHLNRLRVHKSLTLPDKHILRSHACTLCGEIIENITIHQRYKLKRDGLIYHKIPCSMNSKLKIQTTKNNMTINNPMFKDESRNKMSSTLKRINHKPKIQGGNGRGLTRAQENLMKLLSDEEWAPEFIIKTHLKPKDGFPYHYKIDIANENKMIAIELDGPSHFSLKQRKKDIKKTNFLISVGWKVLRFSNQDVFNSLNNVMKKINEISS